MHWAFGMLRNDNSTPTAHSISCYVFHKRIGFIFPLLFSLLPTFSPAECPAILRSRRPFINIMCNFHQSNTDWRQLTIELRNALKWRKINLKPIFASYFICARPTLHQIFAIIGQTNEMRNIKQRRDEYALCICLFQFWCDVNYYVWNCESWWPIVKKDKCNINAICVDYNEISHNSSTKSRIVHSIHLFNIRNMHARRCGASRFDAMAYVRRRCLYRISTIEEFSCMDYIRNVIRCDWIRIRCAVVSIPHSLHISALVHSSVPPTGTRKMIQQTDCMPKFISWFCIWSTFTCWT